MKFICEKDALLKEISIAQEIVSKGSGSLSILSNVFLVADNGTLHIKATDLKVSFETKIPVEVAEAGSVTVLCELFAGILKGLSSGDVSFEANETEFIIKPLFKKAETRLKIMGAEKFPEIPSSENEKFFEFSQKDIIEMISQTSFAISHDITRYFMNGVYLEQNNGKLAMVATDGRRLSFIAKQAENALPDFKAVIVPDKILNLVRKLVSGEGNISIAINEKNAFFSFDNQKLSTNLIEGSFPNYQKVIPPEQTHRITVNRGELSDALKIVAPVMDQKAKRIYISFSKGSMKLSAEEEKGVAKEEIPCDYDGEDVSFALNCLYLSDPLREIRDESIVMEYTDVNKAITLKSAEERDYFHIVMPMNI